MEGPAAHVHSRRARWHWTRRVLAGNPFYLMSAALLLFGINRLSVDPDFLGEELANLIFNFSALQFYEVLLVLVAIILARRRIWYDSTLLIGLENVLVLVPFILVTQAILIGNGVALALCLAGTFMVVLRFLSMKHFISELNMPPRLLGLGLIILLLNLALPVYFRSVLEDTGDDFWERPNQVAWLVGLPLLQLLGNTLPKPTRRGEIGPERSWLPISLLELWIAATAIHLWCIAYVAMHPCGAYLLAPLLWALAWTVRNRIEDFVPGHSPAVYMALLFAPALATLVAAFHENSHVFLVLTLLNALGYARLWVVDRKNHIAFELLLASLVALIAALPPDLGRTFLPEFSRGRCVELALGAYLILQALLSGGPQIGTCGALVASMAPVFWGLQAPFQVGAQIGLAFLLLHSLRWRSCRSTAILRTFAAAAWMLHSLIFTYLNPTDAGRAVSAAAVLVFCCYVGFGLVTRSWAARIVPVSAAFSLLAGPASFVMRKLITSPSGLLAVLASFVLFGIGTLVALTKPRWQRSSPTSISPQAAAPE